MSLLAAHMQTTSEEQLSALYEACVSLLAAEERQFETVVMCEPGAANESPLLRTILDHINRNICDPALAPPGVAHKLGISVRYLHKLFAASGATFGAYVLLRRLDHVRNALIAGGDATIAELARTWGFRDISAFNKAFRKQFGCAPRRLRSRGVLSNSCAHQQAC
jgi:AraC-like DNA-binding protein